MSHFSLENMRWYERPTLQHGPHTRRDGQHIGPHPKDGSSFYNQMAEATVASLGSAGHDFFYPRLLVTLMYHVDLKTRALSNDAKLYV